MQTTAPNPTAAQNKSTEAMTTMSEVIAVLRERGYSVDLNLLASYLESSGGAQRLYPNEFEVDGSYRFEGESNPADSAVIYAISSKTFGIKGILINAYGVYADPMVGAMAEKFAKTPKSEETADRGALQH